MARKQQKRNGVFCVVRAEIISRTVSEWSGSGVSQLTSVGWWVTELVRELRLSRCELLLWEAGSWSRDGLGNPEAGECPLLEAATKQRLVKTSMWALVYAFVIVEYKV
jgi:hypothetical protein